MSHINYRELSAIFTDVSHHKTVAKIVRTHSTNKQDVRAVALDGLDLQNTRHAIDLGCGFGFFTRALKNRVRPDCHLLGIDLCAKYKTSYLESCKMAGLYGEFLAMNNKTFRTIPAHSIDLIICSYALYFFPEIIPEISNILKPTGIFVAITHAEKHLKELIPIIRDTYFNLGIQYTGVIPCQQLSDNFNGRIGYQKLSPWFGLVKKKEFPNTLCFDFDDFDDLKEYLSFKQAYYIPGFLNTKTLILDEMTSQLNEYVQSVNPILFTKNDTIFICTQPLYMN